MNAVLLAGLLAIGQMPAPADTAPADVVAAIATPPAPDRWPLMQELQGTYYGWLLDGNKLKLYGWVDAAYTASSASADQLPLGLNYRANEFDVLQAWMRFERPVDQSATTPTFGFRIDTFIGIDYRFTVARGLFDGQLTQNNGEPNTYGADPVQFYAEAYFPHVGRGLDVKLGRFFGQFGVESIDSTQNAFVSASYNFFYDPFTHTGLLTTLKLTDTWSVQNGMVTGCDVFIDPASTACYIGSVKWAPPGRSSALFSVVLGNGRYNQAEAFHNPEIFDLVVTHKLGERLTYTGEGTYGFTTNVPDMGFANWWATVHYLSYTLAPMLTAVSRLELFDDVQGQRTGFAGLYVAPTVGVNIKPNKCLTIRPEVRFDYNVESRPFEDKHGLLTAALDFVARW